MKICTKLRADCALLCFDVELLLMYGNVMVPPEGRVMIGSNSPKVRKKKLTSAFLRLRRLRNAYRTYYV